MMHFDSKRLALLKGEDNTIPREYMFVGIDDFSRELYVGILPDKTQQMNFCNKCWSNTLTL